MEPPFSNKRYSIVFSREFNRSQEIFHKSHTSSLVVTPRETHYDYGIRNFFRHEGTERKMQDIDRLRTLVGLSAEDIERITDYRERLSTLLEKQQELYQEWFCEAVDWPMQQPCPFLPGYLESFIGGRYGEAFFSMQYRQAVFWRKRGIQSGTIIASLSKLRDLFFEFGNQMRALLLARSLCRVVDLAQSIQAVVHHLGQLLERHQQTAEQSIARIQQTFQRLPPRDQEGGILNAYVQHLNWKINAYQLALGTPLSDLELPLSPHECTLGKWLEQEKGIDQIPKGRRSSLIAAHERLHRLVENATADVELGRPEAITRYLLDLDAASDEITIILDDALAGRLTQMAIEDTLTRLPNRRQFERDIERKLAFVRRTGNPLGLLVIDIDHFKHINDSYGHSTGDELLCAIAQRLATALRSADSVYRWGGEEFTALVWPQGVEEIESIAERIRSGVSDTPFEIANDSVSVTVSIGGALSDATWYHTPEDLFRKADYNLAAAKSGGRNRIVLETYTRKL